MAFVGRTLTSLTLLALLGAACGDDVASPGEGDATTEDTPVSVDVGVLPFAELAAFHLALEEGIFEEHGLDVTAQGAMGGGAIVASMISGDIPIAYSNYVTLIEASERGLDVRVFRENDRPGVQALYVAPDSDIESAEDLAGRSVAVNSLGNIMDLTTRAVLDDQGIDHNSVDFIELAPPDMESTLVAGDVDAAWLVEPFVTLATGQSDVRRAVEVFTGPTEDLPVAGWATTQSFLDDNPEVVANFKASIDEAMDRIESDPGAAASVIPTYTELPEEVAADLEVGFAFESDLSDIARVQELMIEFGIIDGEVDIEELLVDVD